MIFPDQAIRIVIATKPVDFRKSHDGLASMAQAELGFAPKAGVMVSVVRHAVFTSNQGLLRSQNTQKRYLLCRFSVPLLLRLQIQRRSYDA
jgi:hypothetical protein